MAKIPMVELDLPDLPDTYTFAQFDAATGGMGTEGTIPDSKAVKDELDEIKEDLTVLPQALIPIDHVTGKYVKTTGADTSASFEYYKYEIHDY